ncbi:MAG: ATP-grasp fold amidoligase family protein [Anaerolineaceae bacterium]
MQKFVTQKAPVGVKSWIKPWYYRILAALFSDEQFIRWYYRRSFGRDIDLNNPRTFNEKIQYLKLNYHKNILSRLVDKYEVRQYVKERGLEYTLNQLYGVYERIEDLKIDQLPDAFVIKMTHGSRWNIICPDKNKLKWDTELSKLRGWLKENYYFHTREWAYKQVKPRIIVEKYLDGDRGGGTFLSEYKFYCFNGKPGTILVARDRYTGLTVNFYDLDWNLLPWRRESPNAGVNIPKPAHLGEMLEIAQKLSYGLIFARIDLYDVQGKIIFGEVTIYSGSGFSKFYPDGVDLALGEKLDISGLFDSLRKK